MVVKTVSKSKDSVERVSFREGSLLMEESFRHAKKKSVLMDSMAKRKDNDLIFIFQFRFKREFYKLLFHR